MANKIHIKLNETLLTPEDAKLYGTISSTLLEDQMIEFQTTYTRAGELIGGVESLLTMGTQIQAGANSTVSSGWVSLANAFSVPLYTSTDPPKMNVRLGFFTKTNPKKDVSDPVRILVAQSILSYNKDNPNIFDTPGVSLSSLSKIQAKGSKEGENKQYDTSHSKFISVWIPGVIYIPSAVIKSARPLYSRQYVLTNENLLVGETYPLWATVELEIEGLFPAHSDILKEAIQYKE